MPTNRPEPCWGNDIDSGGGEAMSESIKSQLLSELSAVVRMIDGLPQSSVIDRMSLESRKSVLEAEIFELANTIANHMNKKVNGEFNDPPDNDWSLERLIQDRQSEEGGYFQEKKPVIKTRVLKKHNWFVCLFSKKKREERKRWEARWGKYLTEAQEIEIIPMKYEPHEPFYLDYTYKNKENNMSKWITDRLPTVEDAPLNYVWTTINDRTGFSRWDSVKDGVPWMLMLGPDPYEKPKQYVVQGFDGLEGVVYEVYSMGHKACVAGAIKTREAAERIAAIYEEVKP